MRWMLLMLAAAGAMGLGCAHEKPVQSPRAEEGKAIYADEFRDLHNWVPELEKGGTVDAANGQMVVDVPGGCTVWFRPVIDGPVAIEYEAKVVSAGGPNDRVSDLNCFWMATDARSPGDLFAAKRSGKFSDYDQLRCYYVGLGGNSNTTTRFRRYVGEKGVRPMRAEDDLAGQENLITANVWQQIRLVADGPVIQYWRDGRKLFELRDPQPYTRGNFALRTVDNHMLIRHFRVYRLPAGKPG